MDQDSFRLLLQSSKSSSTPRGDSGSGTGSSRGNNLSNNGAPNSKKVDSSQPAFKPRKVKKAGGTEGKYRDRAAERRGGGRNDYAHVEAIFEDFERRNAKNEDKKAVEEQRKYLGGDGEHSILVKGLDMALLEQNKARAAREDTEDDDTLEQAFLEASFTVPKKRTRADIVNALKQKRSQPGQASPDADSEGTPKPKEDVAKQLEAKRQSKFKPIGLKPVGGSSEEKEKKKKKPKSGDGTTKEGGERKKKKRKVEAGDLEKTEETAQSASSLARVSAASGAGDYDGLDLGSEEEDEDEGEAKPRVEREISPKPTGIGGSKDWFATEDDEEKGSSHPSKPAFESSALHDSATRARFSSPGMRQGQDGRDVDMEDGETRGFEKDEQRLMRLQPLESSALPSIRDFLAMGDAAEAAEKRRKRKEKKKAGGGGGGGEKSTEQKVNRDFQRLQSYTSKKEASGSR
ncbi:Protein Red [Leucoagaricus sp. SymC.cos]|nr:Protein Red [Leucoagaricus sp. SymC.cos]